MLTPLTLWTFLRHPDINVCKLLHRSHQYSAQQTFWRSGSQGGTAYMLHKLPFNTLRSNPLNEVSRWVRFSIVVLVRPDGDPQNFPESVRMWLILLIFPPGSRIRKHQLRAPPPRGWAGSPATVADVVLAGSWRTQCVICSDKRNKCW